MAKKNLGLFAFANHDWAGGLYYILNIIESLNSLEDTEKPNIIVFYNDGTIVESLNSSKYPYIKVVNLKENKLKYSFYHLYAKIFKEDLLTKELCKKYSLDAIYPYFHAYRVKTSTKIVSWYPDFQHKCKPEFFGKEDLAKRDKFIESMNRNVPNLVVSSQDTLRHYRKYYPKSDMKVHVLPFNSNINLDHLPDEFEVLSKYQVTRKYFIVSNQVCKHKNHRVVLEALRLIADEYKEALVLFTGLEKDNRHPGYQDEIKNCILNYNLNNHVKSLGFIPRSDQLSLMRSSIGVIQPSKFEGWGTVVEDAKTLNKQVLASDIKVHHEQLKENAYYFKEDDFKRLSVLMMKSFDNELKDIHQYEPLNKRNMNYSKEFMNIIFS